MHKYSGKYLALQMSGMHLASIKITRRQAQPVISEIGRYFHICQ